jgi:hypothetical protein
MQSHRPVHSQGFDDWIEIQASLPPKFKAGQPKQAKPPRKSRERPIHSFAELAAKLRSAWLAHVVVTDLRKPPLDPKYSQRVSAQKFVRELLNITDDNVENAKSEIDSQHCLSQQELNLDEWPTRDRIRESF